MINKLYVLLIDMQFHSPLTRKNRGFLCKHVANNLHTKLERFPYFTVPITILFFFFFFLSHNWRRGSHFLSFIFLPQALTNHFTTVRMKVRKLLLLLIYKVGWFLRHINLCRIFKNESIFIQINSSISNNSV